MAFLLEMNLGIYVVSSYWLSVGLAPSPISNRYTIIAPDWFISSRNEAIRPWDIELGNCLLASVNAQAHVDNCLYRTQKAPLQFWYKILGLESSFGLSFERPTDILSFVCVRCVWRSEMDGGITVSSPFRRSSLLHLRT